MRYKTIYSPYSKWTEAWYDFMDQTKVGAFKIVNGLNEYNSKYICTEYRVDGKLHRIGNPAMIDVHLDDHGNRQELKKIYYINGEISRLDGPAVITKDLEFNKVVKKIYMINGERHRDVGPAVICNHENYHKMEFYKHGEMHNELGPAQIYRYDGTPSKPIIVQVYYYLYGQRFKKESWENEMRTKLYW